MAKKWRKDSRAPEILYGAVEIFPARTNLEIWPRSIAGQKVGCIKPRMPGSYKPVNFFLYREFCLYRKHRGEAWIDYSRQLISSEVSEQSTRPSHFLLSSIHWPLAHWNWPWRQPRIAGIHEVWLIHENYFFLGVNDYINPHAAGSSFGQ